MKSPYLLDARLGLEYFITDTKGTFGKLRSTPEDFFVEELQLETTVNASGDYTHFTLEKNNWDTLRAIKEIARRLKVSQKRFGFAGTKDKRAVTGQKVSVWKVGEDQLRQLKIKDIRLLNFKKSDERVSLGDLYGNRFKINVRGTVAENAELDGLLKKTVSQMERTGIPNYFGYQRFGTIRPNTHLVGKELVKGDIRGAVLAYLANPCEGEREDAYNARRDIGETGDYKTALKLFPKRLNYERSMLDALSKNENDYAGALRRLPKKLRWMLVHAYQGYLFNRVLSRTLEKNIESVSIPLFGCETLFTPGEQGDIEMDVIEKEEINLENFDIASMPELTMEGQLRDAFIKIHPKFTVDGESYTCEFDLPKGSYATVALRELMKADPLNY